MKNLLNISDREQIIKRIESLPEDAQRQWGKMNANEMLCHTADQLRMATGTTKTKFVGNFFLEKIFKGLVLAGFPTPKGKIETVPELKQGAGGTKPKSFKEDKLELIRLINHFAKNPHLSNGIKHPAFGEMNSQQWGRLAFLHLDHHLKQFGA